MTITLPPIAGSSLKNFKISGIPNPLKTAKNKLIIKDNKIIIAIVKSLNHKKEVIPKIKAQKIPFTIPTVIYLDNK